MVEILIDNYNINTLSETTIRNNISVVSQSPYIFNLSIKENIRLANPKASDKEIEDVCRKAQLHDAIMEMQDGYETIVGENGVILSGGQKQRLAIARVLIKKSKIVLFDEATSSLDNNNQEKIKNIIKLYKYNEFEDLTDIFKLNPGAVGLQLFIDDNEYTTECFKRPPINNHYPVFYFEYEKHYHLLDIMFYSNEAKNSNCPEFMMYMKKYDDGGYDKKTKIKIRDLYIKIIKTAIKLFNKIYEIYPGFFYGGIDHNFFYLNIHNCF